MFKNGDCLFMTMKVIIVTGSVGTGKTTISKKLAEKLNLHYINANKIVKKYNISEGYDKKRKTEIVDVKKLNEALIKEIGQYKKNIKNSSNKIIKSLKTKNNNKKPIKIIENKLKNIKKGIIIDSHLSHYLPNKYTDLCIVAKCDLKILKMRLNWRKYSKKKTRENLDAEIFDICLNEAKENKHNVLVIDSTNPVDIKNIISNIKK